MKKRAFCRILSLLLCALLLCSTVLPSFAFHVTEVYRIPFESNGYFYTVTEKIVGIDYECENGCEFTIDMHDDPVCDGDDYVGKYVVDVLSEIDRRADEHGYCEQCYEDYLCVECYIEKENAEMYCEECHKCNRCWDQDSHCRFCASEADLCEDCKALGYYRCDSCHDLGECDGCGRCLVAAEIQGEYCTTGDSHCTNCHEPWICEDCGECFYDNRGYFCQNCGECLDCAVANGNHCRDCVGCFMDVEVCDGNDELCWNCCVAEGNHCAICEEHVEDWCEGGKEGEHCRDCAEEQGWICETCDRCKICNDFDFCSECGYCEDCCLQFAAETGCECLEYCVESGDFYDPEHMCEQCTAVFSCNGEAFCETCGLCQTCCTENAESLGCICGLCVEDSEFDEHLCPQCGEPTCVKGDLCEDCGLCAECCLENSETAGCSCGICVQNSDFDAPDHICDNCGAFSCNIEFCDFCGFCEECCANNAYDQFGCSHGVCVDNPDWEDHYCETCEKCKEDCSCGQPCCDDPWAGQSLHDTATEIGKIFIQPSDKVKTVTEDNPYDRADNTVVFRTKAYDPYETLQYQWYYKVDGGAPVALTDQSQYIEFKDETLVFVDGALTNRLTVAVPVDACHKSYTYFCVISDGEGNAVSSTHEARLIGKHAYRWTKVDKIYHQQVCISEGCGHLYSDAKKKHEIGPWHFQNFATTEAGAMLVRSCNVCGGVAETMETDALDETHTAHDYMYIPNETENANGETVSKTHIKLCRCGKTSGNEELHTWDQWIITEFANDKHKGSKYHECLLCHYRETVEIPKQTHEHTYNIRNIEEELLGRYDNHYHWVYCLEPDCKAIAFKEAHVFDPWFWWGGSGEIHAYQDGYVERTCTICGYQQIKKINAGYRALCFQNANYTALSADNWDSEERYTLEVTAKPPTGYYFDH